MDNARGAGVPEPEPRLSVSSVNTGLAGSNRSGKHRLLPDTAEESDPAGLTAGPLPAQERRGRAAVPGVGLWAEHNYMMDATRQGPGLIAP